MVHHFVDLLLQIIRLWFGHMGTTAIGLGCGLISSVYDFWVRQRREGMRVKPIWKDMSKGAKITLSIWCALFMYCTGEAVYSDHEQLVSANSHLALQNSQLIEENKQLKAKIEIATNEASKDAENRRRIREHLGRLLSEGNEVRNVNCRTSGPQCEGPRNQWEQKVERYLKANLDSSYTDRWRTNIVKLGGAPMVEMWGETDLLSRFIVELK
jgi:regulator of replication initiation timing